MNRKYIIIICCCLFVIVLLSFLLPFADNFPENYNSNLTLKQQIEQYKKIVELVRDKTLAVQSNGCIILPEEHKHLSDSGECFLVQFNDDTAIYFYSYRGILGASKGHLYITDQLCYMDYINTDVYVPTRNFVNIIELDDSLYSVSTE